jgi:hypothetical protein
MDPVLHSHDDQAPSATTPQGTKGARGSSGSSAAGFLRALAKSGASLKAKVVATFTKLVEGGVQEDPTSRPPAAAATGARKHASSVTSEPVRWHSNAVAGARRGSGSISSQSSGVAAAAPWPTVAGGW